MYFSILRESSASLRWPAAAKSVFPLAASFFLFWEISLAAESTPRAALHWAFDGGVAPLAAPEGVGQVERLGEVAFSDDVPGRFVYDPLTRRSRANTQSLKLTPGEKAGAPLRLPVDFARAGLTDASLTFEAFIQPAATARGDAWLFGKSRVDERGSELALEFHELRNSGQTWHGAGFAPPGARPTRFAAGHYSSSTRLTSEHQAWRHVAVVYDAQAATVTCWVDYHLSRRMPAGAALVWDAGPLLLGGRAGDGAAAGLLDEARLTRGALGPAEFLRACQDELRDVSFASKQTIAPRDAGCLDVKEHFGAVGDGQVDDTAAFNAAFAHLASKVPLAYNTLLIPPGEYRVSDTLYCSRFIDVKGAGPDRTVIRLRDGVFRDPARSQPVLRMSSTGGDPGSNRAVNGSSISIYLEGLTIDVGRDNAGAKALEYHSNNLGRLENVVLRGVEGGAVGLDLTHHDCGPALVKRVRVEGFDVGVATRYQEYSMTFEHLALRGQRVVGLRNEGNILAIRGLVSENRVTALASLGANSMVVLLDAALTGGAAENPAIRAEGGLYCARVRTAGYGHAVAKRALVSQQPPEWKDATIAGPDLAEYVGDQITTGHGSPAGALRLPIEETPEPPVPSVSEWVNVTAFASAKRGDDWSPAVQAAIDSGARVVYFPANTPLSFASPIHLRGQIERLVGHGGELNWAPSVWRRDAARDQTDPRGAAPPLLVFDEPNAERVVVLDRLGCVHLRHASPATLVLRSCSLHRYTTGLAGGKLFVEDAGGADWRFEHPQRVWVRQWNPESHESGPCVYSNGATIWALGFKTEYESQKLLAEGGAATEILGAFIYPIGKIPRDRPIFENRDSRIALVYGTSVYASNHAIHVRDARGENVKLLENGALRWAGSRARMDLYTSDAR